MQDAGQLAKRAYQTTCNSTTSNLQDWSKAFTNHLFALMRTRYGSTYSRVWSDDDIPDAKRSWVIDINKLTHKQAKHGVEVMFSKYVSWPPSLNEFIQCCYQQETYAAAKESYKPVQLMITRERSEEEIGKGREELNNIKNLLK